MLIFSLKCLYNGLEEEIMEVIKIFLVIGDGSLKYCVGMVGNILKNSKDFGGNVKIVI